MKRIKALWLCSWYPDKMQPQNGDFLQRLAIAASTSTDITTIHVAPCPPSINNQRPLDIVHHRQNPNLQEYILYYEKKGNSYWSRAKSTFHYFRNYTRWIEQFINSNGKPDIIHVNIAFRDGIVALWIWKKYHIPYVLSEHSTIYQNPNEKGFSHYYYLQKWIIKKIFQKSSAVLPVSIQLGECLKKLFSVDYKVIPNVVDTQQFVPRISSPKLNTFSFIHISDASEKKNVPEIIEAFKKFYLQYPQTRLMLLGGNPAFQTLNNAIGYPAIEILSNVSYTEVSQILSSAQCCIINSFYETFSCVIIESLACSVPVISTNIGVAPEIIDGTNGIIIEHTKESLLASMESMYLNYSTYLTNQSPEKIRNQFSYKKIGADINAIYSDVLNDQ